MNGQILPIDAAVFEASNTRGTIVDTGTTLTYLVKEAYDPFLNAVSLCIFSVFCMRLWLSHHDGFCFVSADIKQRVTVGHTDHF